MCPADTPPADRFDRNDDPSNPFGGYRLDGLYFCGPAGMYCVLAVLIDSALLSLRTTASSPDGVRKRKVRYSEADKQRMYSLAELREMEAERRRPRSGHPFYARPVKPATSGRKRRAA